MRGARFFPTGFFDASPGEERRAAKREPGRKRGIVL